MNKLTLRFFTAGSCLHPDMVVSGKPSLAIRRFPMQCALIHHPSRGLMLFDTGYSPLFFKATQAWPYSLYPRVTPVCLEQTLCVQLALAGIDPRSIEYILLSHLHADHCAAVGDFPQAQLVLAREAWNFARNRSGFAALRHGLVPALLAPLAARPHSYFEDVPRSLPFADALFHGKDLWGDGSMLACALPGHAAGHYGLFCPHTNYGSIFLLGDAVWTREALDGSHKPLPLARWVQHKPAAASRTLHSLRQLVRKAPHIVCQPSHSPAPEHGTVFGGALPLQTTPARG